MMSNIIGLFDGERRDRTITPPAEIGADGLQSLFESWSSISSSLEQLRDYVDNLKPVLEALPDGPEKAHVDRLVKEAAIQIRDSLTRSIAAGAAVARLRRNSE
jgi:hypothetical protein